MAIALKVLFKFLRIIRDYIKGHRAAFLGGKLIVWWRFWFGNFRRPKPAERPSFGIQESSYSVSGGSAVVKKYVVAASYVPSSASYPSLDEHAEGQPEAVTGTQTVNVHPPILASISVDQPHADTSSEPSHPLSGGSVLNRSYGNLSDITIQSRASDRLSIMTTSPEPIRAPLGRPSRLPRGTHRHIGRGLDPSRSRERSPRPPSATTRPIRSPSITIEPPHPLSRGNVLNRSSWKLSAISIQSRASHDRRSIITNTRDSIRAPLGQPSQLPRGIHRHFGRGPDPSRSRERPPRSPTPTTRPNTPLRPLSITTNLPSLTRGDDRVSPVVQSGASSFAHEPWRPPPMYKDRRSRSTTVAVDIQNPSTNLLPPAQITDEPLAMDSPTEHSSGSSAVDVHLERHHAPHSPTSSNYSTEDHYLIPDGRYVQLIHSEQIPRYTKGVTMQVGYTILLLHPHISLQNPRRDNLRCKTFNNQISLVRCNLSDIAHLNKAVSSFSETKGSERDLLQNDCTPWIPATHPDGALYFYDEERVRVSLIVEIFSCS